MQLLGPGDPPPFELHNEGGGRPCLLICDHASAAIPKILGDLGLDAGQRRRHIAWDIGIAEVTRRLAILLNAPAVLSGYSRLVIDCNRHLEDPSSIAQESDDVPVPGNRRLDAAARAARETAGLVLAFRGAPISAFYSASCGGRTRTLADAGLRAADGYPYFSVECAYCVRQHAAGDRNGHGVGLCQEGAAGMAADHGASFAEILQHYYPGTTLEIRSP